MIKLFSLKDQKATQDTSSSGKTNKKVSAAELRITKGTTFSCSCTLFPVNILMEIASFSSDLSELNLPKTLKLEVPDKDDLTTLSLVISPDEVRFFLVSLNVAVCYYCQNVVKSLGVLI